MLFKFDIYFKILIFPCIIFNFVLCRKTYHEVVDSSFRIAGGTESEEAYPYLVSIQVSGEHYCGGTLIGPYWVLTVGHCFILSNDEKESIEIEPRDCKIVIGALDLRKHDASGVIKRSCEAFYRHPQHRFVALNDIGLIRLHKPVLHGKYLSLPKSLEVRRAVTSITKTTYCKIMGWGKINYREKLEQYGHKLREAEIALISTKKCSKYYAFGIISVTRHLCTRAGQIDSCTGDSGGPMVCNNKLYGMVSFGYECGSEIPSVYVRVDAYSNWIYFQTGVKQSRSNFNCNNGLIIIMFYFVLHIII